MLIFVAYDMFNKITCLIEGAFDPPVTMAFKVTHCIFTMQLYTDICTHDNTFPRECDIQGK